MRAKVGNIDIEKLKKLVLESDSMSELIRKLGYGTVNGSNHKTVNRWLNKYGISTSHFTSIRDHRKLTANDVFRKDSDCTQKVLRTWYIRGNYTEYRCSICGQDSIWNGKELTLILDHINGINNDNRLENLRFVCPNCNQQLPTTGFHGKKYK